jgi:hypothetical protein
MRDFVGQEIKVGDVVFYGQKNGESSRAALARVVEVGHKLKLSRLYETARKGTVKVDSARVVVKDYSSDVLVVNGVRGVDILTSVK